ncbi:hypothetical protein ACKC9G_02790 [Pokkaliibacter sp. CJK22405]|uniref:hypothetical protein n=1 Tax=Pokkaliibacter sp. CJK22405 TaxID=3384615 RepID=UPI003984E23E
MDLGSVSGSLGNLSYNDTLGVKVAAMAQDQQKANGAQALKLIEESTVGSGPQQAKPDPDSRLGLNVDVSV